MKRLWLTVLLLSLAAVGFADASNPADISNLPGGGAIPLGTIHGADMSIKYLGQLFGSVGGVLSSPGHVQLLQELFAIFNKAILALALAWTSYTIVTVMFNSAMEGGFITSQRKHAVFIFGRLALGFSLLLPLSSGYSALQVIGMRALLEGVNLANQVWDKTIVFVAKKGILHSYSDKDSATTSALIGSKGWNGKAYINSPKDQKNTTATQALMYDMLCTAYYAAKDPSSPASQGPIYTVPTKGNFDQYINFPSKDSANGCGQYRLDDATTSNPQQAEQAQVERSLVDALWPVAQSIISAQGINENSTTNSAADGSSAIAGGAQSVADALRDYVSATQLNIANNKKPTKNDYTGDTTWEVQAADQGWFGAGRFYWLLSKANWYNVSHQNNSDGSAPSITWPTMTTATGKGMPSQSVVLAANAPWNDSKLPAANDIKGSFNSFLIPAAQSAINAGNTAFSSDPTGALAFNGSGLCADGDAIGNLPSNVKVADNANAFSGFTPVPNGENSSTWAYMLISSFDSGTLSSLASSATLGVCGQTNPADGQKFTTPVLVAFNDSTYGQTTCPPSAPASQNPAGDGTVTSTCTPQDITAADKARQALGNLGYPGVRICPAANLTTVDPNNITSEVGYCNSSVAQYAMNSSISSNGFSDPQFAYHFQEKIPVLPDVIAAVAGKFSALEIQNSQGLTDPIYFMTQLGATMLGQAGELWEKGSDQIAAMAGWQGLFSGVAPGATIFSGYMNWWEPVFIGVGAGLFTAGFMLCFYAPLYPFVLYLLGALNWLMVVVEFMIALPLVALGVTHPEGHDFLGKAEVALMLTLSACLRPVLMVFGYVGGMIMSYIGFSAVNYMFSSVLVFVFGNMPMVGTTRASAQAYYAKTPSVMQSIFGVVTNDWTGHTDQAASKDAFTGNTTSDMLLIPLLMVFYGYIVVEVVHFCFTMIHQLPDQVLRWIGGPVAQDRTQGVADKIQSGTQGAAKQAAEIQGKSTVSAGKAHGEMVGGSIGGALQVGSDLTKMGAAS